MEMLVGKTKEQKWLLAGRNIDVLSWSSAGKRGGSALSPLCGGKVRSHQLPRTHSTKSYQVEVHHIKQTKKKVSVFRMTSVWGKQIWEVQIKKRLMDNIWRNVTQVQRERAEGLTGDAENLCICELPRVRQELTGACTCWVVIGGAYWERWPQFRSVCGPPAAAWAHSIESFRFEINKGQLSQVFPSVSSADIKTGCTNLPVLSENVNICHW